MLVLPRPLHNRCLGQIVDLLGDVYFHQLVKPCDGIRNRFQFTVVEPVDVLNLTQPLVQETKIIVGDGILHTAAVIVAAHDDVFYLEELDSVLQHAQEIEIGVHHQVCYVSVHEQFARLGSGNFFSRHTRVGTPDPHELRGLGFHVTREEVGPDLEPLLRPRFVRQQQLFICFHLFSPLRFVPWCCLSTPPLALPVLQVDLNIPIGSQFLKIFHHVQNVVIDIQRLGSINKYT